MFLVTSQEMAEIEQKTIHEWGIPAIILMENAGLKVVEEIKNLTEDLKGKKITVIAGRGNNGGDALVVARHLYNQGADIKVFLVGNKEFTGPSLVNYEIAQKLPLTFYSIDNDNDLHLLKLTLHYTDFLVDGLFGTGFQGQAKGMARKVIETINEYNCYKIAIDLPSGVNADNGKVLGPCIKADSTVTFALPKVGLAVEPGISFAGTIKVVDISIPNEVIQEFNPQKIMVSKEIVNKYLPRRRSDSHKGTYGHLLIVGGSVGMMGAPYLSGRGGFALGAGLVTMVVPKSIQQGLATTLPEAMVHPASETGEGTLGLVSGPEILKFAKDKSAIVIGPGMGFNQETAPLLKWLLSQKELENTPIVIDADALKGLGQDLSILKDCKVPVIITPHPGEMARILKTSPRKVQENRIEVSQELAKEWGIWVVLKGKNTIIATPQGQILVNPTGSPALATAGTGDILAGMIGAIVGQNQDLTYGIATAVYLHGLAGQYVSQQIGEISSKALDIIDSVAMVIKKEFGQHGN
ncbi:MAG: NAD(P)H-hydrate dehydratase [Clostridia bacterium]|nr:NAD(P)H-hydrate dehydratase [Clostridia bacterium]